MTVEATFPISILPNYQPGDRVTESSCGAVVDRYKMGEHVLRVTPTFNKCLGCSLKEHCDKKKLKSS